jgi:hypothetical protein
MLRVVEVGLLLAPFVAFVVWRVFDSSGGPSNLVLGLAALGVLVLAAGLFLLVGTEGLRRGQVYVPATVKDGQIVPGHAVGQ